MSHTILNGLCRTFICFIISSKAPAGFRLTGDVVARFDSIIQRLELIDSYGKAAVTLSGCDTIYVGNCVRTSNATCLHWCIFIIRGLPVERRCNYLAFLSNAELIQGFPQEVALRGNLHVHGDHRGVCNALPAGEHSIWRAEVVGTPEKVCTVLLAVQARPAYVRADHGCAA